MYIEKKSKILIAFLGILLALSVGYAFFSDTITITGTALSKGSFDMTATCQVTTEDGGTGVCSVNGNTVSTQSSLSKPGDIVEFTIRVTNSGTIPAKLKTLTTPNNAEDLTLVDGKLAVVPGDLLYVDVDTLLTANYKVKAGNTTISGDSNVFAAAQNLVLEQGYYFDVIVHHEWADIIFSEYQPELPEEGATMSYDLDFGFEQVIQ